MKRRHGMAEVDPIGRRKTWYRKFACAFRGLRVGVVGHSSFFVHLPAALGALAAAAWLQVSRLEWCLVLLCVAAVISSELLNSALEAVARAVDARPNQDLADGLDAASGAVLVISCGAVLVGGLVFLPHLARLAGW